MVIYIHYLSIMSNISYYIQTQIEKIAPGQIIQLKDFNLPSDNRMAMAKELSRLVRKGILNRLEKGKYFKPRKTTFGILKPSENEIIKTILVSSKGYLSGVGAFNSLGLTSQISNTIEIAVSDFRPPKKIAGLKIKFRKSNVNIIPENGEILQILDAIRYINKIPDSKPDEALTIIIAKIKSMSISRKKTLLEYAFECNPTVRAIIGAIFELSCKSISVDKLYNTLNPLSSYRLEISDEILPNKSRWKIK